MVELAEVCVDHAIRVAHRVQLAVTARGADHTLVLATGEVGGVAQADTALWNTPGHTDTKG